MTGTNHALALVGRIALAVLFIWSGFGKVGPGFARTAGFIASKGLPVADMLAALTVALEIGGGILLLIGYKARWVAVLLALWLIPTTLIFHRFWGVAADQVASQQINFFKNTAIFGGMLLLAAFGPGRYSVDRDFP